MTMLQYPLTLLDDTDGYTVQLADLPEAITYGATLAEMLDMARDALSTALEFYLEDNRPIPLPSAANGRYTVMTSPQITLKILLHNEMLSQGVSSADLSQRLNTSLPTVERLLKPRHKTQLDAMSVAFAVLGRQLDVHVQ